MEVLLGVHIDIILFQKRLVSHFDFFVCRLLSYTYGLGKQYARDKVVEDFADLRVLRNVLLVQLDELIFALRQIREHFVIEVDARQVE